MKNKDLKKMVFIAHPISGDVLVNIEKVLNICKTIHDDKVIPCVPYLATLKYLDYEILKDKDLGVMVSMEYFYRGFIDELWLFGDVISKGMKREINLALDLNIPIISKSDGTKDYLKENL